MKHQYFGDINPAKSRSTPCHGAKREKYGLQRSWDSSFTEILQVVLVSPSTRRSIANSMKAIIKLKPRRGEENLPEKPIRVLGIDLGTTNSSVAEIL